VKYPHQDRVNGRRHCDHLKNHLNNGSLQKYMREHGAVTVEGKKVTDSRLVPQVCCPLCLETPRPRHGNEGKFGQFAPPEEGDGNPTLAVEHANSTFDAFDNATAKEDKDAALAQRTATKTVEGEQGLAFADLQGMSCRPMPKARHHDRWAPFRTKERLVEWLKDYMSKVAKPKPLHEQRRLFYVMSRWLVVGERYFINGWEAHDIWSENMRDFESDRAVEGVIARMREAFREYQRWQTVERERARQEREQLVSTSDGSQ
jgi:hypothetical protein